MNILKTRGIEYKYPDGTHALKGIDLSIEKGKKIVIMGKNGAGKSTLFLHLNGILKPVSGEVVYEGKTIKYNKDTLVRLRSSVGIVFQNPDDQLFAPTVLQDVAYGPLNQGLDSRTARERSLWALKVVEMEDYINKPPHFLSGGQKKRVAIAGILAMGPEVIILDEPLSDLDPAGKDEVKEILEELNIMGKTVIISTHDPELAYAWGDHIYIMKNGTILDHGNTEEIFADIELLKKAEMNLPPVLEIYHQLMDRGIISRLPSPRNALELVNRISNELMAHMVHPRGSLYVLEVGGLGQDILESIMIEKNISHLGAMGTKAKFFARNKGIDLDFSHDVINNCLLKAMGGQNTLIITSGKMVQHTRRRVEDYNLESRENIMVEILPSLEIPIDSR